MVAILDKTIFFAFANTHTHTHTYGAGESVKKFATGFKPQSSKSEWLPCALHARLMVSSFTLDSSRPIIPGTRDPRPKIQRFQAANPRWCTPSRFDLVKQGRTRLFSVDLPLRVCVYDPRPMTNNQLAVPYRTGTSAPCPPFPTSASIS